MGRLLDGVRRRLHARAAGAAGTVRAPSRPAPTGSSSPAQDRLAEALTLVRQVERAEPTLPEADGPAELWARRRVVRRPDVHHAVHGLLPTRDRAGWDPDADEVRVLSAHVAADLVVTAKLDLGDRVKLRAAYGQEGRTLALQETAANGVDGIARAVRAHEVVARHAPSLGPRVLGHGRLGDDVPYLVEEWVQGRPLGGGARLGEAAPEILAGLARLHRGHGLTGIPLSEHWSSLARAWRTTVGTGVVPADLGEWVQRLIARDGLLRRSWVHGDLVASNVMGTQDGIVLIDWEHAQEAPIMNDGAKLHLFSGDPAGTLEHVVDGLGETASGRLRTGQGYAPVEELALAHANLISRYPARRARLEGHPRAEIYERQVRRQVERLEQVRAAAS